jgi:hypothetical protein
MLLLAKDFVWYNFARGASESGPTAYIAWRGRSGQVPSPVRMILRDPETSRNRDLILKWSLVVNQGASR